MALTYYLCASLRGTFNIKICSRACSGFLFKYSDKIEALLLRLVAFRLVLAFVISNRNNSVNPLWNFRGRNKDFLLFRLKKGY